MQLVGVYIIALIFVATQLFYNVTLNVNIFLLE